MDSTDAWAFLPIGYICSVLLELIVLLPGLASRHSLGVRVLAGFWLTACTYPVVILMLPAVFNLHSERTAYLLIAESFAPAVECAVFLAAFGCSTWRRDCLAITAANLLSFTVGELVM